MCINKNATKNKNMNPRVNMKKQLTERNERTSSRKKIVVEYTSVEAQKHYFPIISKSKKSSKKHDTQIISSKTKRNSKKKKKKKKRKNCTVTGIKPNDISLMDKTILLQKGMDKTILLQKGKPKKLNHNAVVFFQDRMAKLNLENTSPLRKSSKPKDVPTEVRSKSKRTAKLNSTKLNHNAPVFFQERMTELNLENDSPLRKSSKPKDVPKDAPTEVSTKSKRRAKLNSTKTKTKGEVTSIKPSDISLLDKTKIFIQKGKPTKLNHDAPVFFQERIPELITVETKSKTRSLNDAGPLTECSNSKDISEIAFIFPNIETNKTFEFNHDAEAFARDITLSPQFVQEKMSKFSINDIPKFSLDDVEKNFVSNSFEKEVEAFHCEKLLGEKSPKLNRNAAVFLSKERSSMLNYDANIFVSKEPQASDISLASKAKKSTFAHYPVVNKTKKSTFGLCQTPQKWLSRNLSRKLIKTFEPEPEPQPIKTFEPEPEPQKWLYKEYKEKLIKTFEPEPEPQPIKTFEPEPEPQPEPAPKGQLLNSFLPPHLCLNGNSRLVECLS